MASAAAVGADYARSPIENDLGEDRGLPGEITSGVYPRVEDGELPDVNGNDEEDNDDDLPSNPLHKRGGQRIRNSAGTDDGEEDEGGVDGLFSDDEAPAAEDAPAPAYGTRSAKMAMGGG